MKSDNNKNINFSFLDGVIEDDKRLNETKSIYQDSLENPQKILDSNQNEMDNLIEKSEMILNSMKEIKSNEDERDDAENLKEAKNILQEVKEMTEKNDQTIKTFKVNQILNNLTQAINEIENVEERVEKKIEDIEYGDINNLINIIDKRINYLDNKDLLNEFDDLTSQLDKSIERQNKIINENTESQSSSFLTNLANDTEENSRLNMNNLGQQPQDQPQDQNKTHAEKEVEKSQNQNSDKDIVK